ncbi:hypothetical protein [Streptomyces sp. NPDC093225]
MATKANQPPDTTETQPMNVGKTHRVDIDEIHQPGQNGNPAE